MARLPENSPQHRIARRRSVGFRGKVEDRTPDRLTGVLNAEHCGKSWVEIGDGFILGDDENSEHALLDQAAEHRFLFAGLFFGKQTLGNVVRGTANADNLAVRAAYGFAARSDPSAGPVRAQDLQVDLVRRALRATGGLRRFQVRETLGRHEMSVLLQLRQECAGGLAENPVHLIGPFDLIGRRVPHPIADMGQTLRLVELRLALLQCGFDLDAVADVARDAERVPSAAVRHGGYRQIDWKFGAVFADGGEGHGLAEEIALAGHGEVVVAIDGGLAETVRRQQPMRAVAHDLVGLVAESAFSRRIPIDDVAVRIGDDDRVLRVLADAAQAFVAFLERRRNPFAVGDLLLQFAGYAPQVAVERSLCDLQPDAVGDPVVIVAPHHHQDDGECRQQQSHLHRDEDPLGQEGDDHRHDGRNREAVERRQMGRVPHRRAGGHAAKHEGDEDVIGRVLGHEDGGGQAAPERAGHDGAERESAGPAAGAFVRCFVLVAAPEQNPRADNQDKKPDPCQQHPDRIDRPQQRGHDRRVDQIHELNAKRAVQNPDLLRPHGGIMCRRQVVIWDGVRHQRRDPRALMRQRNRRRWQRVIGALDWVAHSGAKQTGNKLIQALRAKFN